MHKESENYFLPYQLRWLEDRSLIKLWEKSRRIGATYVQSFEDVMDCAEMKVPAVYFTSADESAAKEYIAYCEHWARILHIAAKYLGENVFDSEHDIKSLQINFANGTKIHALSSSPKSLRSKGGKIVIDEFSHHENPEELWRAARPVATWGYPIRILSTHNGAQARFYKFIEAVEHGKLDWSLHRTDIFQAVNEGFYDKILGRVATDQERQEWIDELRRDCFDEETWQQEYCCVPIDESSAFLSYEMIAKCELADVDDGHSDLINAVGAIHELPVQQRISHQRILQSEELAWCKNISGDLYLGMDIGRKKDLSVIWVLEKLGVNKYSRRVHVLERAPFNVQRDALFAYLAHPKLRRACIDATGLGMQLAEEAVQRFGEYRVEAITFTAAVKEELAYNLRRNFEQMSVYIPSSREIREDLHSVKKTITASGNIRFDAERSDKGHSDRFWALALALHAGKTEAVQIAAASRMRREAHEMMRGYW